MGVGKVCAPGVCLLLLLALALPAHAQIGAGPAWGERTSVGAGFTANGPDALLGASLYTFVSQWRNLGIFLDYKQGDKSLEDDLFVTDITVDQALNVYGDLLLAEPRYWRSYSAGIAFPILPELALYAGGGIANREQYLEFEDNTLERGLGGVYRISDPDASTSEVNLLGGLMFRFGERLLFRFGGETAPRGLTVGVALLFPVGR